jgi:hypothetical protein
VALNWPSTGFAVLMVVTLADGVDEDADAVEVTIDCATAGIANRLDYGEQSHGVSRLQLYA